MAQTPGNFQYFTSAERTAKVKGADIATAGGQYPVNWTTFKSQGDFVIMKSGGNTFSSKSARYLKVYVNGSTVNTSAVFNELEAYDTGSPFVNVAAGKTVTASEAATTGALSNFVDGDAATFVVIGNTAGEKWIKVDLGAVYNIRWIRMWLFYTDGRAFINKKIEYSTNDISYTEWFNSNNSATIYPENSDGMVLFGSGGLVPDTNFLTVNINAARAEGVKVGAYFFKNPNYYAEGIGFQNEPADAVVDATQFYNWILDQTGSAADMLDILPCLDFENQFGSIYPAASNNEAYNYIAQFTQTFKDLTGRQIILYSAYYTVDTLAATNNELVHTTFGPIGSVLPLWLAATDTGLYPSYSYTAFGGFSNNQWLNWQFSSDGNGQGATWGVASTDLDLNVLDSGLDTITPPQQVTGVSAVAGNTTANISWALSTATDIEYYSIYVDGIKNGENTSPTTYTIIGLNNLQQYSITVAASDAWEEGPQSAAVLVTPLGIAKPSTTNGMFIDLSFNNTLNSTVVNSGTAFSYAQIKVTFLGSATNYQITNAEGLFIRMLEGFVANDILFIDLQKQSVTKNNINDMVNLDLASRFFNIPIGITSYTTTNTEAQTTQIILQEQYL